MAVKGNKDHTQAIAALDPLSGLTSDIGTVKGYLAGLAKESSGLDERISEVTQDASAKVAEEESVGEQRWHDERRRLLEALAAKDAKIKDIQSKFAFVLGTIKERSDVR